jgi:hypothetical protein
VAQLDTIGFARCKKAHRILVHEPHSFEIENDALADSFDLRFKLFDVFRLEPTTQAQNR